MVFVQDETNSSLGQAGVFLKATYNTLSAFVAGLETNSAFLAIQLSQHANAVRSDIEDMVDYVKNLGEKSEHRYYIANNSYLASVHAGCEADLINVLGCNDQFIPANIALKVAVERVNNMGHENIRVKRTKVAENIFWGNSNNGRLVSQFLAVDLLSPPHLPISPFIVPPPRPLL